ncbi:hypothetical protein H632_c3335p0, partial [Helicosporidium sp. ATCC 50920]
LKSAARSRASFIAKRPSNLGRPPAVTFASPPPGALVATQSPPAPVPAFASPTPSSPGLATPDALRILEALAERGCRAAGGLQRTGPQALSPDPFVPGDSRVLAPAVQHWSSHPDADASFPERTGARLLSPEPGRTLSAGARVPVPRLQGATGADWQPTPYAFGDGAAGAGEADADCVSDGSYGSGEGSVQGLWGGERDADVFENVDNDASPATCVTVASAIRPVERPAAASPAQPVSFAQWAGDAQEDSLLRSTAKGGAEPASIPPQAGASGAYAAMLRHLRGDRYESPMLAGHGGLGEGDGELGEGDGDCESEGGGGDCEPGGGDDVSRAPAAASADSPRSPEVMLPKALFVASDSGTRGEERENREEQPGPSFSLGFQPAA